MLLQNLSMYLSCFTFFGLGWCAVKWPKNLHCFIVIWLVLQHFLEAVCSLIRRQNASVVNKKFSHICYCGTLLIRVSFQTQYRANIRLAEREGKVMWRFLKWTSYNVQKWRQFLPPINKQWRQFINNEWYFDILSAERFPCEGNWQNNQF